MYKNELHKACFDLDAANSISKDLAKRIISEKIFKDKAYSIPVNPKYNWY